MKTFYLVYTDSEKDSELCNKDHKLFVDAGVAMKYIIDNNLIMKARTQIVFLNEEHLIPNVMSNGG